MSDYVSRTCTEVGVSSNADDSQSLSHFRDRQAYVLVGDPGSGKTTEFQEEAQRLGGAAAYVSARRFIRDSLVVHPEWQGKTLFIDGLDEQRSGSSDPRISLDQIIEKLGLLERPRFRISCREADWLGPNDRQNLNDVCRDSLVTVLRIDPLSLEAATELLRSRGFSNSKAERFIKEAGNQGLGALLGNPLTLILLADAVAHSDDWPESRMDTFEMACQKMAEEHNQEHLIGSGSVPAGSVLEGAGYLSALYLLADLLGFSSAPAPDFGPDVHLDELIGPPAPLTRDYLERALKSRLFAGGDGQGRSPLHRHVAEFMAGRHLARLIDDGLPASRVVALMTSPSDARVVTPLRSLSAWLAAHSPSARQLLIDADPVGVGLYGDIEKFTSSEKKHLLMSLVTLAIQEPLFGHESNDNRSGRHWIDAPQAFRSLASGEMAPALQEYLATAGNRTYDHRSMQFVLEVLSNAEESATDSLADLSPAIESILRDAAPPSHVRESGLNAYLHIAPEGDAKARTLLRLLEDIKDRMVSDPEDDLRGGLLRLLYPIWLTPSEVWQYVHPRNQPNYFGQFARFWRFDILKQSSDQHVAELLDSFCENRSQMLASLEQASFEDLPLQLLDRGLEALGDDLDSSRLYNWLDAPRRSQRSRAIGEEADQRIRAWLEARPLVQKSAFLTWIRQHESHDRFEVYKFSNCHALHWSTPPADFGLWCLENAIELDDAEPFVAQQLLRQAYRSLKDPAISEGLSLEIMRDRTCGHRTLAQLLRELCEPPSPSEESSRWEREQRDRIAKYEEEEQERRSEWETELRSREAELRENRFSPPNLRTLALAYFGMLGGSDNGVSPDRRIGDFIGGDPELVDAVLAALRGAAFRHELPEPEETIKLRSESRQSWLALPALAGLEMLFNDDPALVDELDTAQRRKALAIHYCVPTPYEHEAATPCHDRWLEQDPELVLDVLDRCTVAAMRAGEEFIPAFNDLDRVTGHEDLVHKVRIKLLSAFPVRASNKQLPLLDGLLGKALRHPDKTALASLVHKKLGSKSTTDAQRVRWLVAGALLAPVERRMPLREFVGDNKNRVRHLAAFFRDSSAGARYDTLVLKDCSSPELFRDIIEMMGRWCDPPGETRGWVTLEIDASWRVAHLITQLGFIVSDEAHQALTDLSHDPQLSAWHEPLTWTRARQSIALRDADYHHPSIKRVQRTLSNGLPANAADLAALVKERLNEIALRLRGENTNLWRHFWNEDQYGRPTSPKPEESCRDAILAQLREAVPSGVAVEPERHYAASRRADMTVSYGGHNIPIELKKDTHPELWTALRAQLIDQYTTDPATDEHGIYMPLWFGLEDRKPTPPPKGHRPSTAMELEERLEQDLTPQEAQKVSVLVLDVSKPAP